MERYHRTVNGFAYVLNNPLKYIYPSGHRNCEEDGYNCWPSNTGNGGTTGGIGTGGSGTVRGQQGGLPLPAPLKGYPLSAYEFNLLTIATYAESQNYSWPDDLAIEMIVWVYLNRIQLLEMTMVDAIAGNQCQACSDPVRGLGIAADQLKSEGWVSDFIQKNVVGP